MGAPQLFQLLPWTGGLQTAQDESIIPPNALTVADNVVFSTSGTRRKRQGWNADYDNASSSSAWIVGATEFFYGSSSKTQKYVSVTNGKKIYAYTPGTGARSADLFAGTAWGNAVTTACFASLGNTLVIAVDGANNVLKKYNGSTVADLGGTPPAANVVCVHQGRVIANDKTAVDRVHFSSTFNAEEWGGTGDSGAIDVGTGDSDASGITALFSFLGDLYVCKKTKIYRLRGPLEDCEITLVSENLGVECQNSVVKIEDSEVCFASSRGFHFLSSTDRFGDTETSFLSFDIQKTFNERFVVSRLPYICGIYVPSLNSVLYSVTDSAVDSTSNNAIYAYSVPYKAWTRFTGIRAQALFTARDSAKIRWYAGTDTERLVRGEAGTRYDTDEDGNADPVNLRIDTGFINLDGSLYTLKRFSRVGLAFRADGSYSITVTVQVDGFAQQAFTISDSSSAALLGSTFILGTSVLGSTPTMGFYAYGIDGLGRAIKVRIQQAGANESVDIIGLAIEYEAAGTSQEVL